MGKVLALIGIIAVAIGTILSLWTVLTTNLKSIGTWGYLEEGMRNDYKKQKRLVIIGIVIILLGSLLQCIAIFL